MGKYMSTFGNTCSWYCERVPTFSLTHCKIYEHMYPDRYLPENNTSYLFQYKTNRLKDTRHICCITLVFYVFIVYVLFFFNCVCSFVLIFILYICFILCLKKPKTPEDCVKSGMEEMTETSFGQWPIQSFFQTCWQNWLSIKRRYIQVVLIPGTRSYICTGKRPLTWVICY